MNSQRNFRRYIIYSMGTFFLSTLFNVAFSVTDQDANVDLMVKGSVSKGTCSFAFTSKVVEFSRPIISRDIDVITNSDTPIEPFSVEYICQDYNEEVLPDLQVTITADNNSHIVDGKLAPKNNVTNAAFAFQQCNSIKGSCSPMTFNSNESMIDFSIQNGDNEKHFEVSVIKLNNLPIQAGKLSAAVVFTFLQP
ncbi:hypothetical protein C9446_05575 [Providencia heimbachae]|uniref:fimbrial protein n=1 Tax=Providencia heimbachae TaxID=333962 RepID=UPI0010BEF1CD|nr:hypothetical protein C9446_05575 [Providencia heimbachae]